MNWTNGCPLFPGRSLAPRALGVRWLADSDTLNPWVTLACNRRSFSRTFIFQPLHRLVRPTAFWLVNCRLMLLPKEAKKDAKQLENHPHPRYGRYGTRGVCFISEQSLQTDFCNYAR